MKASNEKQKNETHIINGTKKQKVTIEDVKTAIWKYKTESPSELAQKLDCSRMTIYRKLQEIPHEEIEAIFQQLAESELKPAQMQYEIFCQIPEVIEYDMILARREISKEYRNGLIRGFFNLCVHFKKHPNSFNKDFLETIANELIKLKEGKVTIEGLNNEHSLRSVVRSWYMLHGISGALLSSLGIGGEHGKGYGKRALDKITSKQRKALIKTLKEVLIENGYEKQIPIWISLVYWLFYTGTRITASLKVQIERIKWSNEDIMNIQTIGRARVTDKGRHRKGRIQWNKLIAGDLKEKILANLESRGYPEHGLLFEGINYNKCINYFREAYERANIVVHQTAHVWRHTGAQELLDATDWNYEVVGSILGWKDTKTLKECYGKMGESVRERALKKAMGIPVEEKFKEFKF